MRHALHAACHLIFLVATERRVTSALRHSRCRQIANLQASAIPPSEHFGYPPLQSAQAAPMSPLVLADVPKGQA
jgi:hypothetical protein